MRVVYKYTPLPGAATLVKGSNAVIRHVASVDGHIRVWVEHDEVGESRLTIDVVSTGTPMVPEFPFLGTVITHNGALVHHVYGYVTRTT